MDEALFARFKKCAVDVLGVSEDQVVEDLELLFVCGTPGYGHAELIDAQWDSGHIYLDNADDIAAPMRLSRDEAVSELRRVAGAQLDPRVVEALVETLEAGS